MFWNLFLKNRKSRDGLILILGIGLASLALANGEGPGPKPWPERLFRSLRIAMNQGAVNLSSALFNQLDKLDTDLFAFPGNGKGSVEVRRDVIDNFDLLNTFTVIDKARILIQAHPLSKLTTWTEEAATSGIGTPFVGIVFDPQTSIEWMNIRQVGSLAAKEAAAVDDKKLKEEWVADANKIHDPLPEPSPDPDLSILNPDVPLALMDPSLRARFSRVQNLATFPFRLPLHRSDVSRMKDGEIIAYAFDGQIETGISTGLKIIPSLNVIHAGIDLRGTVLLHGRYQISVLRESSRHARVKLTRLKESGRKNKISAGIKRKNAVDGFQFFKKDGAEGKHFPNFDLNFIPFELEKTQIRADQFDIVYRYDLESKEGRNAFHQAVLGRFALSEDTTSDPSQLAMKRVEKLLSRDAIRTSKTTGIEVNLVSFLKLEWNAKKEVLTATLDLPDGTHHILEGLREKRRNRKTFFGATTERRSKRMTLSLDAELLAKQDPNGIFMVAEVTDEDSSTSGKELNKAIDHMEEFLRDPEILPTMATHNEGRRRLFDGRNAWYGRSSFYYGYSLTLPDITAFLRCDRSVVENSANRNLPEASAKRLVDAWDEASLALATNADANELFRTLDALFTSRFPIEAFTNVVFDSLPEGLIDHFVTAQNVGFGRIQVRGKTKTSVENALAQTERELGFDTYAKRLKQDAEATVTSMRVQELASGLKELHFSLTHTPTNVFFRFTQSVGLNRQKTLAEIVVNNQSGRFNEGENTLVLDPNSTDLLVAKISRDLRRGEVYSIAIAYARTFDRYGPVATSRFNVDLPYPERKKTTHSPD